MNITLSQFAQEVLKNEGITNFEEWACALLEKEAKRLWYVQRSKPKRKDNNPRSVGRPRISVHTRKAEELGDTLRGIYLKLKEFYGEETYLQYFKEQEQEIEAAIKEANLDVLQNYITNQPWVKMRTKHLRGA